MIHSFDVFDTLITRRTYSPQGIFVLMQHRLMTDLAFRGISEYVRANFATLRPNAETLARKVYFRGVAEEITLPQIYESLALTGCLTQEDASRLMQLERETELNNVVGINENIEKVRQLIRAGEQVICVSDMYLDMESIRAMLVKADPIFWDVPIYVSSESKFLKGRRFGDGNLFRCVKEKESGAFSDWVHIGDNSYSDIVSPKSLGIQCIEYKPGALRPYEKRIVDAFPYSPAAALAIGTARTLRINRKFDTPALTGCSFAGPVLFSYVYWVLTDSVRRGFRRLYFVARDGNIPMKIANIIIEYLHLPIETHYVYGSRRAWRMACYGGAPEELSEILSLSSYDEVFTIKQFASILQITEEELYSFFPAFRKIPHISALVYAEMKKVVADNAAFRAYLVEKNSKNRYLLQKYLLQELDVPNDQFAFVEMNGSGYSQLGLTRLMRNVWRGPVYTYFFKMDQLYKDDSCKFLCYFPRFWGHDMLLEVMTRALQEQTVGYRMNGGQIVPALSGEEGQLLDAYQYHAYEEGVLAFCKCFVEALTVNRVQPELPLVNSYMSELLNWTRCREFLYFAEMPFCNSGRENGVDRFAPRLTDQQIEDIYLWSAETNPRKYYTGTSLDISLLRCTDEQKERIIKYTWNRNDIFNAWNKEDPYFVYPGHERIPFEILGQRIVLYGAGKYGRKLYQEAQDCGIVVTQWLDANYEGLRAEGLPVTGTMNDIGKAPYNRVVVAILNLYLAEKIRKQLIDRGVPEEKIYCPVIEAFSI